MILGEKIERNVHVYHQNFVSEIQLLIKHSFHLSFLHELHNRMSSLTFNEIHEMPQTIGRIIA